MEKGISIPFFPAKGQGIIAGPPDMSSSCMPAVPVRQEVLSGGYQEGYTLTGPSQYEISQVLNNSDIVHFNTVSQVKSTGPGLYEESMMLHSAGAAASGVTCGVDSLDADGANFTATPYCETVVVHSSVYG